MSRVPLSLAKRSDKVKQKLDADFSSVNSLYHRRAFENFPPFPLSVSALRGSGCRCGRGCGRTRGIWSPISNANWCVGPLAFLFRLIELSLSADSNSPPTTIHWSIRPTLEYNDEGGTSSKNKKNSKGALIDLFSIIKSNTTLVGRTSLISSLHSSDSEAPPSPEGHLPEIAAALQFTCRACSETPTTTR